MVEGSPGRVLPLPMCLHLKACCVQVFERVPVQPRDAREASDVFYKQGTGDVLLNYENEVYFTNRMYGAKDSLPYIVPDRNIRVSLHQPFARVPGLCTSTAIFRNS